MIFHHKVEKKLQLKSFELYRTTHKQLLRSLMIILLSNSNTLKNSNSKYQYTIQKKTIL